MIYLLLLIFLAILYLWLNSCGERRFSRSSIGNVNRIPVIRDFTVFYACYKHTLICRGFLEKKMKIFGGANRDEERDKINLNLTHVRVEQTQASSIHHSYSTMNI